MTSGFKKICAVLLALCAVFSIICLASCSSDKKGVKTENHLTGKELKDKMNELSEEDHDEYIPLVEKWIAFYNGDYDAVKGLFPEEYWKTCPLSEDQFIADLKAVAEQTKADNERSFGKNFVFSYEIITEKNHSDINDDTKINMEVNYGIGQDRIGKEYYLNVSLKLKSDSRSEQEVEVFALRPLQIDGKWYVANETGKFGIYDLPTVK